MLCFFLLSAASGEVFTCTADFEEQKGLRSAQPKPLRAAKAYETNLKEHPWSPIRIEFKMESIGNPDADGQQCKAANVGNCQESDILTPSKVKVIKETFEAVKVFLESNLNVSQYNVSSLNYKDLVIDVWARPFGKQSSGLAFASPHYRAEDGRPNTGSITVNPSKLPDEPQTFYSGNRQFITTVLHEINHIMSFSNSLFKDWKNENGTQYQPLFRYASKQGVVSPSGSQEGLVPGDESKFHTYLSTPKLTEWVNKRFNVIDEDLKTLGLEIEDGGGAGTAGSHPNERLFFTDLMQGRTYGPGYISEIFYRSLQDTGWYQPSKNLIEDYVWLDESRNPGMHIDQKIMYGPPATSFPSNYLCSNSMGSYCFHDSIYTGLCALASTPAEIKNDKYYNPNNRNSVGQDDLLDYLPTVLPWFSCRDYNQSNAKRKYEDGFGPETYGESFTNRSICALSTLSNSQTFSFLPAGRCYDIWCGTDNKVRLIVGGQERYCKNDGDEIKFDGYSGSVTCPPAGQACSNQPRRKTMGANSAFPDRGPIDGKNLIKIIGSGFAEYDIDLINISMGPVRCAVYAKSNEYILCKLDAIPEEQRKDLLMKSVAFHGSVSGELNITTDIPDFYTFTARLYDAGFISAKPAVVLLFLISIVSFFFF